MTNMTTDKPRGPTAQKPKSAAASRKPVTDAQARSKKAQAAPPQPKEPSKTDKVLTLPQRAEGARLDELVAATGWLPHTTRAALTGLKKKGHSVERTKLDGISRYTIAKNASQ